MYATRISLLLFSTLFATSCALFWRPASYHEEERRKEHDALVENYKPAPRVHSPDLDPLLPEIWRLLEASPELTEGRKSLVFLYSTEAAWNFERHAQSGVLLRRHAVVHLGWEGQVAETASCGSSGVRVVQESLGDERWSETRLVFNTQDGIWDARLCPTIRSLRDRQASLDGSSETIKP